jgi:integrase
MAAKGPYMISPHMRYELFRLHFYKVVKELKLNPAHKPHDGRKTFITLCKKADVDEYAIKYMVGHAIKDITEKVYTDRDVEFLRRELSKV